MGQELPINRMIKAKIIENIHFDNDKDLIELLQEKYKKNIIPLPERQNDLKDNVLNLVAVYGGSEEIDFILGKYTSLKNQEDIDSAMTLAIEVNNLESASHLLMILRDLPRPSIDLMADEEMPSPLEVNPQSVSQFINNLLER